MFTESVSIAGRVNVTNRDAQSVAKLVRKLRADKWPHVLTRGFIFRMPDGSIYAPSVATTDEGVIVCWEVAGTANAAKISQPDALPIVPDGVTAHFVVADDMGSGVWVEHEAAALVGVPAEFIAERGGELERKLGRPATDWDVRAWFERVARKAVAA